MLAQNNYKVLMVICGDRFKLAFCKLGADVGGAKCSSTKTRQAMYMDVIHQNGQFYVIDSQGRNVVCDFGGTNPTEAKIVAMMPEGFFERFMYSEIILGGIFFDFIFIII